FVRCLILSQNRAQLVQFDRAGTQLTAFYDIHTYPHIFMGMLLGLTTTADDRAYLGLDDTLSWAHGRNGRKKSGTLTSLSPHGLRVLQLVNIGPISLHRHIRGSGTVCWEAKDKASGAVYLVKDSWSSKGRTPEWELLKRANDKGIKGVCKMAWYDPAVVDVSDFRCASTVNDFFHRTASRVVIEISGEEIDNFETRSQMIRALRDVIAAHGNLYGEGILHRAISNKTILLGAKDAKVGDQGILMDLSLAHDYLSATKSDINKEPILAVRFFQSCAILDFLVTLNDDESRALAPAHDYLDDLEAIFFV
ncbi:hypothetical protein FA13DRAFT_1594336, partial [Coprinellus micaceus]